MTKAWHIKVYWWSGKCIYVDTNQKRITLVSYLIWIIFRFRRDVIDCCNIHKKLLFYWRTLSGGFVSTRKVCVHPKLIAAKGQFHNHTPLWHNFLHGGDVNMMTTIQLTTDALHPSAQTLRGRLTDHPPRRKVELENCLILVMVLLVTINETLYNIEARAAVSSFHDDNIFSQIYGLLPFPQLFTNASSSQDARLLSGNGASAPSPSISLWDYLCGSPGNTLTSK